MPQCGNSSAKVREKPLGIGLGNLLGWLLRVERFLGDGGFRDCHWAIEIEDSRLLIYPIFLPFLILSLVLAPLAKFLKTVFPSFSVLLAWRLYANMLLMRREYDYLRSIYTRLIIDIPGFVGLPLSAILLVK